MKEQLQIGLFDWVEASDTRSPAETFAHKLALAAAADKAGFHAYMLAEHQGTPLSIDSSPAVLLSAMIQRTERLRLGALTFCLPWYNPYRFYNEVCMLDQLSRGRLELGIGRGVSPIESQIYGLKSIEESREKYRETLEVFFAACQSDTLNFQGKYYSYREAELHLKPWQQPYPPLWFPSSNKESIEFTASHGYHTAFLGKLADCKPHFDRYREIWEQHRNDPGRHNAHVAAPYLGKSQHLVIAVCEVVEPHPPSDAQARPPRRAQERSLRRGFGAPPDHRLAAHGAGEAPGDARGDERQLPALHLLLRRPRARARDALAGAFLQRGDAQTEIKGSDPFIF